MEGLSGKVAIITGAGRGIGRGVALALARHGSSLIVNDLEQTPLDETMAQARDHGARCHGIAGP